MENGSEIIDMHTLMASYTVLVGFNCFLKTKWNWFGKKTTWNGTYSCVECKTIFKMRTVDGFENIHVNWTGVIPVHPLLKKPSRLFGPKRKQVALEAISRE
jgi:hypothetical protein